MKRIILSLAILAAVCCAVAAQKPLTPPRMMIVPDITLCKQKGYTQQFNSGGATVTVPDYERALQSDASLRAVLTQIAQLITDRNDQIVIVDLAEAINAARADRAISDANFGDVSESVEEAVIRNSNADILIKVGYSVVSSGPQRRISYTLNGIDPYTQHTFAPVEGMGEPSTASAPEVLIREAVYANMDPFLRKMLTYYQNMCTNGRMVAFDIKTVSGASVDFNTKVGPYTLREVIEDFLYDNSVDGRGIENVKGGATFMQYTGVYIPLESTIRGRQRKQGAKDVAQRLVNYLAERGVTADFKIQGLGKVNIFIR